MCATIMDLLFFPTCPSPSFEDSADLSCTDRNTPHSLGNPNIYLAREYSVNPNDWPWGRNATAFLLDPGVVATLNALLLLNATSGGAAQALPRGAVVANSHQDDVFNALYDDLFVRRVCCRK